MENYFGVIMWTEQIINRKMMSVVFSVVVPIISFITFQLKTEEKILKMISNQTISRFLQLFIWFTADILRCTLCICKKQNQYQHLKMDKKVNHPRDNKKY